MTNDMPIKYPPTKQGDVVDMFHGTAVPDPYRWLEDPTTEENQTWTATQNQLTRDFLSEIPARAHFKQTLTRLWQYDKYGPTERYGTKKFFFKQTGLQNQPILYWQEEESNPQPLIDPNQLNPDGTTSITSLAFSKNGRYLAYGLSEDGSDWQTIHIKEVDTNKKYDEVLHWARFATMVWLPDNSGFFYTRYPDPSTLPADTPPSTYHRIYFHALGTAQAEDKLIYERPDAPDMGFRLQLSDDEQYLIILVWQGTDRKTRLYYLDLTATTANVVRLLDAWDARYIFVGNSDSNFYVWTDKDAPNGRLVVINNTHWQTIIPEGDDAIANILLANQKFVVTRLHHAHHQVAIYNLDGQHQANIPLPDMGTVLQITGKPEQANIFIQFYSFLIPQTIYRYNLNNHTLSVEHKPELAFDTEQYQTTQHFYPSKDGTQVPIFLTYRKDLDFKGDTPTLLYAYGGFNVSLTPLFSPTRLAWLEQGGIYAQANLRGGSEYGEEWHQQGMLHNKQNVFDDFISAAEWLIAEGYTRTEQLAIDGRSNGGLLVSTVMTQRPDLFGAIHCGVPVIDMLRYHRFTAGRYWMSEYGDPDIEAEFETMIAYSPLHNVDPEAIYPPLLITTGDTDDRVVPMHAKKMTAMVQNGRSFSHTNPHLLRIDYAAGHGLGKPTSKLIEEASDIYGFLWSMVTR